MGSRLKQFSVGKFVIYECEPQKCGDALHMYFMFMFMVPCVIILVYSMK